jgi:hypothetical protein
VSTHILLDTGAVMCALLQTLGSSTMRRFACVSMSVAVTTWLITVALGTATATAGTFHFSFGTGAFGSFTTGAAAVDPGYELVTGLTFDELSGFYDYPPTFFEFTNQLATSLQPGAAFNPTTGAFINHFARDTYHDIEGSSRCPRLVNM